MYIRKKSVGLSDVPGSAYDGDDDGDDDDDGDEFSWWVTLVLNYHRPSATCGLCVCD